MFQKTKIILTKMHMIIDFLLSLLNKLINFSIFFVKLKDKNFIMFFVILL